MGYSVEYFDKVILAHHLYRFNAVKGGLEDMEQKGNFLPYDQMELAGDALNFIYNSKSRSIHQEKIFYPGGTDHLHKVKLPMGVVSMLHDQSLRVYDQINRQSMFHKWGFQKLGLLYLERDLGMTPRIELPDASYYLNLKENGLGSALKTKTIPLDNLLHKEDKHGKWVEGIYSTSEKRFLPVTLEHDLAPAGSYLIQFPEFKMMDSYGVAVKEGKNSYHYINEFPIKQSFVVAAFKISQSGTIDLRNMIKESSIDLLTQPKRRRANKL